MSDKNTAAEDRIKRIAAAVADKVRESKAERKATEDNPGDFTAEEKSYIEKAVQDQMAEVNSLQAKQEKAQRKGEFNVSDDWSPETEDDGARKSFNSAQLKMVMDASKLKRLHTPAVADKILEFQNLNDDLYIVGSLLAKKHGIPYVQAVRGTQMYNAMNARLKSDVELRKALSNTASAGAEWIPTGFSNQLVETVRLDLKIAAMFPSINMPTNPYTVPVQSGKATGYLVPENTADEGTKIDASTPTTTNFSFNAKKLAGRIVFSEEIDEDSIVNVLDFTRRELATALAEAREKAVLNGDDSATHQDSNVTSSNDSQKAFKGLRKYALSNAGTATYDFSNAAATTTKLRSLRKLGLKYAVNPSQLAWGVSINGYIQMLNLTEVLTADKLPAQFTVLNGVLGSFDGSPIAVSEFIYDNLNASGVYDGSTTNRTVVHLFYLPGFWIGNRTNIVLKVVEDAETDQIKLIAKQRVAFEDPYDATLAANPQSLLGVNLST